MKSTSLFIINDGVYPYHTGGMEVFNYYLIKALNDRSAVSYLASEKYDFDGPHYIKLPKLPLTRITTPLFAFLYLLFHRDISRVVLSFSSGHWLMWHLYYWIIKLLNLQATVVVHYGKSIPEDHHATYMKLLNQASTVVAVSNDIKRNYDEAYGINCKVVYPLIPFALSDKDKMQLRDMYRIPHDATVFVMVGSLKSMKNPDTVLHAVSSMTVEEIQRLNPFIVYAGDGPMRNELEVLVADMTLQDRVCMLGMIPNNMVKEIMAMSDVYIISSDFEGTSVSLLEAMYNSKVIISSDVPGLRDMVSNNHTGLLFTVKDESSLKESMLRCVKLEDLSDSLAKNARMDFDKRYNYDEMVTEYLRLITK